MLNRKLRIATWNVGQYFWMRHAHRLNFSINGIPHNAKNKQYFHPGNTQVFLNFLNTFAPDYLVIQEMTSDAELKNILALVETEYTIINLVSADNPEYRRIVICKKQHAKNLVDEKYIFKGECHPSNITILNDFYLVGLHFDAFSPSKRSQQATKTLDALSDLIKVDPRPVILCGDTNFLLTPERKNLLPFIKQDQVSYHKISSTYPDLHVGRQQSKASTTTQWGGSLDYIFGSSDIKILDAKVILTRGKYMDHYPIFCDIILPS